MAVELSLPDTENQLLLDRYLEIAQKIYREYQLSELYKDDCLTSESFMDG